MMPRSGLAATKSISRPAGKGLVLGCALALLAASPAFAFGSPDNKPMNAPAAAPAKPMMKPMMKPVARHRFAKPVKVCHAGWMWNKKRHHCVRAVSGLVPDKEMLEQGRLLALAGHYRVAIPILDAIADKSHDPLIYTYLGYSYRKLGDAPKGIAFYQQALAVDPNSLNTHEYLGEGYVALGRLAEAKVELGKVEALCGNKTCEQYADLAGALAGKADE